jgi:hypothetical protein
LQDFLRRSEAVSGPKPATQSDVAKCFRRPFSPTPLLWGLINLCHYTLKFKFIPFNKIVRTNKLDLIVPKFHMDRRSKYPRHTW